MCGVMRCGLEFSQNHNCTTPHFCNHMCCATYNMQFIASIFFKFWIFPTQLKTDFSVCFGPSFKLRASFSLFWTSVSNQHLLGLLNFFFFLKTRVIKIFIIYLILKIYIYILIYSESAV